MNDMISKSGTGLEEWGIVRWQDASLVVQWMLEVHPNGHVSLFLLSALQRSS
jgi:hypothetical protein